MVTMRVAGAAVPVLPEPVENARWLVWAIRTAARMGAEFLVTPEAALSGYETDWEPVRTAAAMPEVLAAAEECAVALALGTFWRDGESAATYNELRFYDRSGAYLGCHRKHLVCGSWNGIAADPDEGRLLTPGDRVQTFAVGDARVGGLICNDLWANPLYTRGGDPHLVRGLRDGGARLIAHAVNTGIDPDASGTETRELHRAYHESTLRLWARAVQLPIVTTDCADPEGRTASSSPRGLIGPSGEWVVRSENPAPHVFVGDVGIGDGAAGSPAG